MGDFKKSGRLVNEHVYENQTMLVNMLFDKEIFSWDDAVNLYSFEGHLNGIGSFSHDQNKQDELIAEYQEKVNTLENKVNQLEEREAELDDKLSELEEKRATANTTKQVESITNRIESLKRKLESVKSKRNKMQGEFDDAQSDFEYLDGLESQMQDVLEWWTVSDNLASELERRNEVLLKTDYGTWWGRCTSGQAIKIDSVICEIANKWY